MMVKRLAVAVMLVGLMSSSSAADWPMFRGDAGRSGSTAEPLPAQLHLAWSRSTRHRPRPAWPRDGRMTFDRAHRVCVSGGRVFFGSTVDGSVTAVDAASGRRLWQFFTAGPVRLAPAAWRDRVFVTSDDGFLYSLSAADGKLLGRWRGGPADDRVLGNGRVISRWPARGGVAIADDVVYWAAGIWQSEGIYLRAQQAATGKTLWLNDSSGAIVMPQPHGGANAKSGVTAQGHLVVAGDRLLVPTGRAVPAVFDRKTGKFLYYRLQQNTHRGGTTTAAAGKVFLNGGHAYDLATGGLLKGLGAGPAVVTADGVLRGTGSRLETWKLVTREGKDRKGQPVTIREFTASATIEQVPAGVSLLRAGRTVVAGGGHHVATVDLESNKPAWQFELDGVPLDLAAADGRLFVGTDAGTLYCFTGEPVDEPVKHGPEEASDAGVAAAYVAAAKEILAKSKINAGYCVDLGCGDGQLAEVLALNSKLFVLAVDADPDKVASARRRLSEAGLLGDRVLVYQADPARTHFPRYVANLVVSGRSVTADLKADIVAEAGRLQRPWGGVRCLGSAGRIKPEVRGPLADAGTWNHQYSTPANTLCSTDSVRGPLRVLWYGDVDLELPSRHGRAPAPLFHEGRLFAEGMDALRAVDAYNGRTIWEFGLPGILHPYNADHIVGVAATGSNFCAAGDSVYVHDGKNCYRLDAATGRKKHTFPVPAAADGKPGHWGYIACLDGILFGSLANTEHVVRHAYVRADMSRLFSESSCLFAFDTDSGKLLWRYDAKHSIRHNTIAIGDGRVFLIDRPAALDDLLSRAPKRRGGKAPVPAVPHATGELLCLETRTGKPKWKNDKDIWGTVLAFSRPHDMLLMSYQSTRFKLPSEVGGKMAVFRATEGYRAWERKISYVTRPLINDRTIIAQPGRLDLLTGEDRPWSFKRSYGCGQLAGSKYLLLFRSATVGYFDLTRDAGTENFGGVRPGCWINAVPAGGLVFIPDASSGCRCSYQNRSWVALEGTGGGDPPPQP